MRTACDRAHDSEADPGGGGGGGGGASRLFRKNTPLFLLCPAPHVCDNEACRCPHVRAVDNYYTLGGGALVGRGPPFAYWRAQ